MEYACRIVNTDAEYLTCLAYRAHGGAPGLGQNLAASAGYKQTGQQVVDYWMSEEADYDPSNPTHSHFTRMFPLASKMRSELVLITLHLH